MTQTPAGPQPTGPQPTPASPAQGAAGAAKPTITYDDFAKLDLRVARVLEAQAHPNADKLVCLKIDLGAEQRQVIAGIRQWYQPEQLVGKDVIVVANLAPRKMRGLESNGMLLAASELLGPDQRRVIVLTTDQPVAPGSSVS
jgi:methionyl-tRNA synthetase